MNPAQDRARTVHRLQNDTLVCQLGSCAQPTVALMFLQPISLLVPTLGILPVWQARADAWFNRTGIKVVRPQYCTLQLS